MANSKSTTEKPAETPQAEQVTITGRLCFDPVLRHTGTGRAVTNLRLAVNPPEGGEASFHSAVVWGRVAETVAKYKRKGHLVEITGTPRTRPWTGKDSQKHESEEINAYRVQFIRRDQAAAPAPAAELEVAA